ncbi:MAG TPA: hypothetical protein EYM95_14135 [Candidatus Obscuribacterales bacterium]|nr:hypothetical protein [Candidatus Obscuribacterales bacterium]
MDLIFEGRLSDQVAMKDVLLRVKNVPVPGLKILRINRQRDGLHGKIAFDGGKYVTAAYVIDSVETGYTALRLLLSIDEGNFALLNAKHGDSIELQPNLHIEIDQLIQTMPYLPDNPSKLFDERALLDKVFGQDFTLGELPALQDEEEEQPIPPPMVVSGTHKIPDKAAWALMQPLIDNESFPPGIVNGDDVENVAQTRNPRKTLTGSPALRQSEYLSKDKPAESNSQMRMIAVAVILLVILAIGVALYLIK